MAHYRNIVIDDKTYEFLISKNITKIKGVGVYQNEDIGTEVTREYDEEYGEVVDLGFSKWKITPAIIENLIRTYNKGL